VSNTRTIVPAHKLRARLGQPGFVVIETKPGEHDPPVSFLFDKEQAEDFADEMRILAGRG